MKIAMVKINKPTAMNFVLGHAHFIKTVEDIQEAIANINPDIEYGVAFSEASGPCLIRRAGNDQELIDLAVENMQALGAGHSFIIFLGNAFPINILSAIKAVPEVCRIHCATANPTQVVIAEGENGNAIIGVVDGEGPKGVESEEDVQKRKSFLRMVGYKQ